MDGKRKSQQSVVKAFAKGVELKARLDKAQGRGASPSAGPQRSAERAHGLAAIVGPVVRSLQQTPQWSSSSGTAPRGAKLVGLGARPDQGLRPDVNGSGQTRSRASSAIVVRNADGLVVEKHPVFNRAPTAAEVKAHRVGAMLNRGSSSVPVASSRPMRQSTHSEYNYMDKRGRVTRAIGHMLLGPIETRAENKVGTGAVSEGVPIAFFLVTPQALGGRLELLSETFEQHKANSVHLEYAPSVPSTTPGAIAIYARNDISTPVLDMGPDELRHAATHDSFIQEQVWAEAALEVVPSDVNVKYIDDEENASDMIQSMIIVETAGSLPEKVTYGNLYMSYDFEFYAQSLDSSESAQYEFDMDMIFNQVALGGGDFIQRPIYNVAPGVGDWRFVPVAGSVLPPNANYVLYGRVIAHATTLGGYGFTVQGAAMDKAYQFDTGQLFWFWLESDNGSNNFTNGTIGGSLFATPPNGDENAYGICHFAGLSVPTTGYVRWHFRAMPVGGVA